MKKILIVSDSHGNKKEMETLRPLIAENDIFIHLGDGAMDAREIMREFFEKTYLCAGNCDFFSPLPADGVLQVEGVKIFYCHGHKYRVKSTLETLALEGKARGADIVLYGHTHTPLISKIDGITLINPGTLKFEIGKGGSYCYLVINGGEFTPVIVGEPLR